MGLKQQALYCYRKAYSLDPTNVDALWDRASLAVEMGELKTVSLFHYPLTLLTHDLFRRGMHISVSSSKYLTTWPS